LTGVWAVSVAAGCAAEPKESGMMENPRYRIEYSTYLGSPEIEQAREVIPYPDGKALIGAQTRSKGMPVTPGVVQPEYAGALTHRAATCRLYARVCT
jgi:hypothetical protein